MSAPRMQVDIRVPVGTTVPGVVDFIAAARTPASTAWACTIIRTVVATCT
jgi:hypothetical protein